jgi:hypothetical protein
MRRFSTAYHRAVIKERVVEGRVGAFRPSELVQIEPELPAARVRSAKKAPDNSRGSGIEQHCPPAEAEAEYRLCNVIADTRQSAKIKLRVWDSSMVPSLKSPGDVNKQLGTRTEPECSKSLDRIRLGKQGNRRWRETPQAVERCRHQIGASSR